MLYITRKITPALVLFLILSFILIVVPEIEVVEAESETIVVPDDYSTINAAINAAADGDIVSVKKGTYTETVKIEKSLTLMGEDLETTIINGNNAGTVILIRHDNVDVTGFTVIYDDSPNSPDPYFLWSSRLAGIHILSSKHCTVYGNRIDDNGAGVWLYDASENNITGNSIARNDYGIRVEHSFNNTLKDNVVTNNYCGIWFISAVNNNLRANSMSGNSRNFGISSSEFSHYINDVDSSNTVDGKPIYYWVDVAGRTVPSDAGCIVLVNCTAVNVQDLSLSKNKEGIIFAFTNDSFVLNNIFEENNRDIYLHNSTNNNISGNEINSYVGITVDSNWTRITNNVINSNGTGISVGGFYQTIADNTVDAGTFGGGTDILKCEGSYNNITRNRFSGTSYVGVVLEGSYNFFHENEVTSSEMMRMSGIGNVAVKNTVKNSGLSVSGSYNLVCANSITDGLGLYIGGDNGIYCWNYIANNQNGVSIGATEEVVYNNTVYNNNFVSNTQQIRDNLAKNDANFWDNGKEGNYWSDYTGNDQNNDGIGDTPYLLKSGTFDFGLNKMIEFVTGQDNYPHMAPKKIFNSGTWIQIFDVGTWEWTRYNVDVVSNSIVSDFSFNPDEGALIQFNVEGENGTTGFCRVTIPKELLYAEGNWIALVDGNSVTPTVNQDANNSYLYFTYPHSTKTIEIIGTTAIPEFPLWTILSLLLAATLAAAVYRKKLTKNRMLQQSY